MNFETTKNWFNTKIYLLFSFPTFSQQPNKLKTKHNFTKSIRSTNGSTKTCPKQRTHEAFVAEPTLDRREISTQLAARKQERRVGCMYLYDLIETYFRSTWWCNYKDFTVTNVSYVAFDALCFSSTVGKDKRSR